MAYAHPAVMICLVALALYVLRLGYARFASTVLGRKSVFQWKRHVALGRIVMGGLFAGMCGGLSMTWLVWSHPFSTGTHVAVALCIALLAVSGAVTGLILDRDRRPGNPLALVHGLCNSLLAVLALSQVYTGYGVLKDFIW
ncbi:DUF4079 family protein [Fundidesulfovibrio terrae]|uniref:DUF4079 family protein n=1 Tax=Fundidesulfovibrio terrae TaxID=2922866 RepID=UPI001FAEAE3F|nr:DUF4079 family protein [Fundidesulfovibrio terrae]